MTLNGGFTCFNCGFFVDRATAHFCSATRSSVPTSGSLGPLPTNAAGPRKYRIHGTLLNRAPGGQKYEVDLVAEAMP